MEYVMLKPGSIARVHCIIDEIQDRFTQRMWERLLEINGETGFETDTASTLNAIINSSDSDRLHQFLDDMRAPRSPVEQRDPMQTVKPLANPTLVQTDTTQDPMGDVKKVCLLACAAVLQGIQWVSQRSFPPLCNLLGGCAGLCMSIWNGFLFALGMIPKLPAIVQVLVVLYWRALLCILACAFSLGCLCIAWPYMQAPDLKWVGAWCAIAWQYMQALDFSWVNGCALAAWTKNVTFGLSPERPRLLYFSTRWVAKLEKRVSTVEDQLRRGFHTKRSLVELSRGARVHARVLKPVNIKAGPAMENLQTLVNLHGKDISVLSDMLHASTVSASTQLQVYDADKAQMQAEISDLKASLKRSEDRLDSLLAALRNLTERVDKQESAMAVMANTIEEQELALGRVEQLAKHTAFVVGIHTVIHMYEALSAAGFFQTVGSWFGPIGTFLAEFGGLKTV